MIDLEKGDNIIIHGTYKVLERVGRGGTSRVYLVRNLRTGQNHALKEVAKFDKDGNERTLVTEDKILKNLYHPNMPRIIDVFDEKDSYMIIMDYVEGITLQKKIFEDGPQTEEDVVNWGIQLCSVLTYLHSQKPPIIYRDMKPANIMLRAGTNNVVLIDFGTARMYKQFRCEDTQVLGTHGYAAPEQEKGLSQTDARTDIYNLGATLFHLLTAKSPARIKAMKPIRTYRPELSSGLEKIILKCTRPDPDDRYQTCEEVRQALLHYHEYDTGFLIRQKRRVTVFVIACAASLILFLSGVRFGIEKRQANLQSYDSVIRYAQSAADTPEKVQLYTQAVQISPGRDEAYIQLLDYFTSDGNFTGTEAVSLRAILNTKTSAGTASTVFEKTDNYGVFAYRLGLAYFYYYDGTGNKSLAAPWFKAALESAGLDSIKQMRAKRLYAISGYYEQLGRKDKAGDSTASYKDYWNDMKLLTDGNIADSDNIKTAVVMYKEEAAQITMHAYDFKKAGITQKKMTNKIADMRKRITSDIKGSGSYTSDMDEEVKDLEENLTEAENAVSTVFFNA